MRTTLDFMVGCGRSGTTMLRSMIDSHPDVAVPRESHFIDTMRRRRDGYQRDGRFDVDAFLGDLLPDVRFLRWDLDPSLVEHAVREAAPADLGSAFEVVYQTFACSMGATRPFDKTPMYSLCVPELARIFPDARFIHLLRDGRSVAASYAATDFGPRGLPAAAAYWRRVIRTLAAAERELGPERFRTFHYEDLVADPESTLRSICDFVDLEFDPRMIDFAENMKTRPRRQPAATKAKLAGPATQGVRTWRDMAPGDVRLIESVAGRELASSGYELSGQPVDHLRRQSDRLLASVGAGANRTELAIRRSRTFNRFRPAKGVWRDQ